MVMKDADPSRRAIYSGIKLQLLLLHRAGFDDLIAKPFIARAVREAIGSYKRPDS